MSVSVSLTSDDIYSLLYAICETSTLERPSGRTTRKLFRALKKSGYVLDAEYDGDLLALAEDSGFPATNSKDLTHGE